MSRNSPSRKTAAAALCLIFSTSAPLPAVVSRVAFEPPIRPGIAANDAREILERVDGMMSADSSFGVMTMTIQTAHWSRTLVVRFWTKGRDRLLMRILSPRKERDTATLRSGSDIWNFLPKTDRIIRVPPASLASSWMGSHFTYDDLLREDRLAEQYTSVITGERETESGLQVEISCTPKPDLPIVWGRVDVVVNRKDDLPVTIRYYDEGGVPVRTLEFLDVGPIGGRRIPRRQRMIPFDKPNEFTEVIYEDLVFNPALDDGIFSFRGLKK